MLFTARCLSHVVAMQVNFESCTFAFEMWVRSSNSVYAFRVLHEGSQPRLSFFLSLGIHANLSTQTKLGCTTECIGRNLFMVFNHVRVLLMAKLTEDLWVVGSTS